MSGYSIVSADSHINEPPELFTNLPASIRGLAPKVISLEKGDAWVMAPGAEPRLVSTSAVAGRKKEDYLSKPVTYKTMRPGSFDPAERIKDMDMDQIDAEILYPGIMRYLERCANVDVRLACSKTYNEWIADFCKHDPKRLVGIGVLPLLDDDGGRAAVEALKDAKRLGLRTAFLTQKDGGLPLHHPDAEPFWAAAEDAGMPISIHVHTNPFMRGMNKDYMAIPGTAELYPTTNNLCMVEHVTLMMFGGVFMRHPKLKVVFAEGGIGWIPYLLNKMDQVFKIHKPYMRSQIKELPSETFKRQCFATFEDDPAGVQLRHMIGVDTLMWASDYPHTNTTWPESKQVIESTFAGVSDSDRRKITCENAARLYGLAS